MSEKHKYEDVEKFVQEHVKGPWLPRSGTMYLYRSVNERFAITRETSPGHEALWRAEQLADAGIYEADVDAEQLAKKFVSDFCDHLSPHDMMYIVKYMNDFLNEWNNTREKSGFERYELPK